ncbi:hypothetical protein [Bacillus sp. JCM 19041]|uniref:hypothetical protein n=1 Tax=Bacillus sp. JCM 19041 TaxID=1460637 RepID=UPI0006CFAB10
MRPFHGNVPHHQGYPGAQPQFQEEERNPHVSMNQNQMGGFLPHQHHQSNDQFLGHHMNMNNEHMQGHHMSMNNEHMQGQHMSMNNEYSPSMANNQQALQQIQTQCNQMKDHHVELKMEDGQSIDGILTEVNNDGITLLVGEDVHYEEARQFGYRYRRYRPRFFPFGRFGGIGFFPYFFPPFFF